MASPASTPAPTPSSIPANDSLAKMLRRNWGWLLALGILLVVLGVIGFGMLVALTVISAIWFGVLLLIGGGAQIVDAFRERTWAGFALHLLMALLYIATGALVVYDPIMASLALTLFIAAALVAVGAMRIVMALRMRPARGWPLLLVGGIISALLGMMIFAQWPASGFWVLGLFLAVELVVQGFTCIMLALAAKSATPRGAA